MLCVCVCVCVCDGGVGGYWSPFCNCRYIIFLQVICLKKKVTLRPGLLVPFDFVCLY